MRYRHSDHIRETSENRAEGGPDALMIHRCVTCRRLFAPTVVRCSSCSAEDVQRVAAAGTGSIVCWRVVECAANALVDPVAAVIAIVELDEGPWVFTTIEGEIPQTGRRPVRVRFRAPPCGDRFPIFAVLPDRSACTA